MRFLREYADAHSVSLYDALKLTADDEIFKGTKARQFISLVETYSALCEDRPISELLSVILDASGYELMLRTEGSQERLDNLAELKQSVYDYETSCGEEATLEHYLAHVALFTNSDADTQQDKVKLMTVHAAKGLEFPYVFLCEMNEGVFPTRKTNTLPGMEEERRLAYVAVTRAEKRLYLSEAEGRSLDGAPKYPSRFLLDIDPDLLEFTQPPRDGLISAAREYIDANEALLPEQAAQARFAAGDRVRHEILGSGTVVGIDDKKGAHIVQFDAMKTPRAIAFKAKLSALDE